MTNIQDLYNHLKQLNKQWFYEKSEVDTLLNGKADVEDIPDVTNFIRTSQTNGLVKNDGTIDTTQYIAKSQTSGLVKNDGTIDTTAYASISSLATVATSGSYLDLDNIPETFAPSSHEHSAGDIKDSNAHTHLGTSANATQSAINTAIDTKIGSMLRTDLVVLASTLPTASIDTMNKLYLIPEADVQTGDAYQVYITVETGTTTKSYDWEKLDTARIDLSNYVTTTDPRLTDARTPLSHTHGNVTNDGKIGSVTGKVVVTGANGVLTTSDWVTEIDTVVQDLISHGQANS